MSTTDLQIEQAARLNGYLADFLSRVGLSRTSAARQYRRRAPTNKRLQLSATEAPITNLTTYAAEAASGQDEKKKETVLYLAYGSNLCYETFQGRRKIQPISQLNVVVPELRMTFDLPGIPYTEPCFANTARRNPSDATPPAPAEYHKDRWKKGLVGVVYEVTPSDYAHIIATEGGGASYQDILVDCYALAAGVDEVPETPTGTPFKAHTLFAPYNPPGTPREGRLGRAGRPDPSYAQPSARYLGLINTGAVEHEIPGEYLEYLRGLRPYTITSAAQRVGQFVILTLFGPFVMFYFALVQMFQDPRTGVSPPWLVWLGGQLFQSVWRSYDGIFKGYFGDGERTERHGRTTSLGDEGLEGKKAGLMEKLDSWRTTETLRDEEIPEKLVNQA